MTAPRILLIAADTARARAYASACLEAGIGPLHGLFYGAPGLPSLPLAHEGSRIGALWIPAIAKPLRDIFAEADWPVIDTGADSINAPDIAAALDTQRPDLVVFAGRGGEIVSAELLARGVPFLHVHPGALPQQRGSTTIYYSILEKRECPVSALLLAPEIDSGPVVARATYPLPPPGIDIDLLYDNAVRADLLVRTLREFSAHGGFAPPAGDASHPTYHYVIHPVLKHLAILSLAGDPDKKNVDGQDKPGHDEDKKSVQR